MRCPNCKFQTVDVGTVHLCTNCGSLWHDVPVKEDWRSKLENTPIEYQIGAVLLVLLGFLIVYLVGR